MSKTNLQHIFWELANQLNAVQAVLYTSNKVNTESAKVYSYAEGFAYIPTENELPVYAYGEGLIGQVAKDKRFLFIDDIPEGYLKVNSGLGAAYPNHILVYPIVKDAQTEAVIELATFVKLEEQMLNLLKLAEPKLLAAIHSS